MHHFRNLYLPDDARWYKLLPKGLFQNTCVITKPNTRKKIDIFIIEITQRFNLVDQQRVSYIHRDRVNIY